MKSSSASHGEVVSLGVTYAMNEIIPFKEREREREREFSLSPYASIDSEKESEIGGKNKKRNEKEYKKLSILYSI